MINTVRYAGRGSLVPNLMPEKITRLSAPRGRVFSGIKILFLAAFFLMTDLNNGLAQPTETAALEKFFPPQHSLLDHKKGDINGDGLADYVLILKESREVQADGPADIMYYRPLLLLLGQPDGTLKQALRNDDVIMCNTCGGVAGDAYQGTVIDAKTGAMTFSFWGGSSQKWGIDYTFTYKPALKKWILTEEFQSFGYFEETRQYNIPESELLNPVSLDLFDYSTASEAQDTTPWVVTAARTYFFESPDLKSTPQEAYLIKGDVCTPQRETKNFISCSYSHPKYKTSSSGFILKKDLKKKI